MLRRTSPGATVWTVAADGAAAPPLVADADPPAGPRAGIVRRWPIRTRLLFARLLAAAMARTVVPYRLAMPKTVSPATTTWVLVPPVAGTAAPGITRTCPAIMMLV